MVFRDVAASDGAGIDVRLCDANARRWLAGLGPALPATRATTTAKTAKTDGQPGGSAYWNEDAELMAQGMPLEQEVSARRANRSKSSTRPDDG